jgi:hypothetical protein
MRHPLDQLVLGVDGQLEQLLVELSWKHPTGRVEERGRRVLVVDPEEERGLWTLKTHPNIDRQLPFWFDLLHSKPIPTQAPPDYRLVSKRM